MQGLGWFVGGGVEWGGQHQELCFDHVCFEKPMRSPRREDNKKVIRYLEL